MKLLVLADLHFDIWGFKDPFAGVEDLLKGVEAVILAGDVAHEPPRGWPNAFAYLRSKLGDVPLHIFPGNHDCYGYYLDAEDEMQKIASEHGANFVQKGMLVFGDTRILCCTLWTDYQLGGGREQNIRRAMRFMNDFRRIKISSDGPTRHAVAEDFIALHEDHCAWLKTRLSEPWEGRTIVVTHHAPHPSVLRAYDIDLGCAFGSDLEALMTGPAAPDLWLYGHSHDLMDARVGRTEIQAVPLGYPDDLTRVEDRRARVARMIFEI